MKRFFALTTLFLVFFCFAAAPLFAADDATAKTEETTIAQATANSPYSVENMVTGPGLLLVGGAGAGITTYNIHKRKETENKPSKEIKGDDEEEKKGKKALF